MKVYVLEVSAYIINSNGRAAHRLEYLIFSTRQKAKKFADSLDWGETVDIYTDIKSTELDTGSPVNVLFLS